MVTLGGSQTAHYLRSMNSANDSVASIKQDVISTVTLVPKFFSGEIALLKKAYGKCNLEKFMFALGIRSALMLVVTIVTIAALPAALVVGAIYGVIFLVESEASGHFSMKFKASVMEEIDKAVGTNSISTSLREALEQCKKYIKTAEDAKLVFNNMNNESELGNFIREKSRENEQEIILQSIES